MPDVFVSYSRRDKEFVEKLVSGLAQDGREIWVDWQDIPRAADWLNEIDKGIENSPSFIFVVSKNSLSSEICNHELDYALKFNKRIVPVIREDIAGSTETEVKTTWEDNTWGKTGISNWTAIGHLNWIFFNTDDESHFKTEFTALLETLDADLEHIKMHTRILVREREWDDNALKPGYLLAGEEIPEAEVWLAAADNQNKEPQPTQLHRDYIARSRAAEDERHENLRRLKSRTTQFRRAALVLGVAIVVAVIAVIFSIQQSAQAQSKAATAVVEADIAETSVADANLLLADAEQRVDDANATLTPIPPTLTQAADDIAIANEQVENAEQQVADANATLAPIPPTLTQAADDIASANEQLSDAEQQVADANATLAPIPPTLTQAADNIASANELVSTAESQVLVAEEQLTAIPPTLEALDLQISNAEERVEALNLAAQALELGTAAGERLNEGNAELAALLAIRSLEIAYNPGADSALVSASNRLFTEVLIQPESGVLIEGAMSGDAQIIVLGFVEGDVRFWDADTGLIRDSEDHAHDSPVIASAFTPNSETALTGDVDGTLIIWDAERGKELEIFEELLDGGIWRIDVSDNGELAAIGGGEGDICIIDLKKLEEDYCFNFGTDELEVSGLDFGADENTLLATFNTGADFWDLDGEDSSDFSFYGDHRLDTLDVAYDPDGDYVLTISDDESMMLWDLESEELIRVFEDATNVMTDGFFSPDGNYIFSASFDGTPRMWDVESGRVLRRFGGHSDEITNITLSDDGKHLFSVSLDGTARIWDADISVTTGVFTGHGDWVRRLAFSPDGRYLASGSSDFTMRVWDTLENTLVDIVETDEYMVEGVAFLPDSSGIIFDLDDELSFWDAEDGDVDDYFSTDDYATKIRITADEQYVVMFTEEESVSVLDLESGDEDRIDRGNIIDMEVAIDANIVVYIEGQSNLVLYDLNEEEEINRFTFDDTLTAVAISPDGSVVMLGTSIGLVKFMDASTGDILHERFAHTAQIRSLAISPDAVYGLSASNDERVTVWDMNTMSRSRVYLNHSNQVFESIFSPDSSRVASSGVDRTVQVWFVELDDLMARVCANLVRDLTENEQTRFGITDDNPTCG